MSLVVYTGLLFGFRQGLFIQAGLLTTILASAGVVVAGRLLPAFTGLALPVRLGLGLYSFAAVWGAVVGVLSSNPIHYVAGQLVAMLMLPAATVVFAAHRRFRFEVLVAGLAAASVVALGIHLIVPRAAPSLRSLLDPAGVLRLRFSMTFAPEAILMLMCGIAAMRQRLSWLAAPGMAAAIVLIVGGLGRGAWISSLAGLLVLVILGSGWQRGTLWVAATAAVLLIVAAVLTASLKGSSRELADVGFEGATPPAVAKDVTTVVSHSGRHALLLDATGGGKGKELFVAPVDGAASLEGSAWLRCAEGGSATLIMEARDASGTHVERAQRSVAADSAWHNVTVSLDVPGSVTRLAVSVWADSGSWFVDDIRVIAFSSRLAAVIQRLGARLVSVVKVASDPDSDRTVHYRFAELHGVMSRWSQAGALRLVVGHGLGAEFPFSNATWNDDGSPAKVPIASYIHNLYVFFAFKLGAAGLAALAGLLLLAGTAAREAVNATSSGPARWQPAAAAAVWAAFLLWGMTSPEIIDFRFAPLLGALVAAIRLPGR
jgi:hypothetical protein